MEEGHIDLLLILSPNALKTNPRGSKYLCFSVDCKQSTNFSEHTVLRFSESEDSSLDDSRSLPALEETFLDAHF